MMAQGLGWALSFIQGIIHGGKGCHNVESWQW
jgi:hypothetical protein